MHTTLKDQALEMRVKEDLCFKPEIAFQQILSERKAFIYPTKVASFSLQAIEGVKVCDTTSFTRVVYTNHLCIETIKNRN